MKKALLLFALSLFISSCGVENVVDKDFTTAVIGVYSMTIKQQISPGITVNKTYVWSITKNSNTAVNIKHKQTEALDPASSGNYKPADPLEHTFTDIVVFLPFNMLSFNSWVDDWVYNGKKQGIGIAFEVSLVGNNLKGTFQESTLSAKESTLTEFNLVKR